MKPVVVALETTLLITGRAAQTPHEHWFQARPARHSASQSARRAHPLTPQAQPRVTLSPKENFKEKF